MIRLARKNTRAIISMAERIPASVKASATEKAPAAPSFGSRIAMEAKRGKSPPSQK